MSEITAVYAHAHISVLSLDVLDRNKVSRKSMNNTAVIFGYPFCRSLRPQTAPQLYESSF